VDEVARLKKAASRRGLAANDLGIAVPGIADARTGQVWAPNIPQWEAYPLRAEIRRAFPGEQINIRVDSDRTTAILGEAWKGAAAGCRDAIFVAVGTGIGAGILVDGRIVRGAGGSAGAIGWLALDRPFRSQYARSGCFESYASGEGLAQMTKELLARRKGYRGMLRGKGEVTAHHVFAAYGSGDVIAKEILSRAIAYWGMASANLISLFDPQKVIFGGGLFGPAASLLDAIVREAQRWAQPISFQRVKFEITQLGSDAPLYGAAYLALHGTRSFLGRTGG
jgi:glucokinase